MTTDHRDEVIRNMSDEIARMRAALEEIQKHLDGKCRNIAILKFRLREIVKRGRGE